LVLSLFPRLSFPLLSLDPVTLFFLYRPAYSLPMWVPWLVPFFFARCARRLLLGHSWDPPGLENNFVFHALLNLASKLHSGVECCIVRGGFCLTTLFPHCSTLLLLPIRAFPYIPWRIYTALVAFLLVQNWKSALDWFREVQGFVMPFSRLLLSLAKEIYPRTPTKCHTDSLGHTSPRFQARAGFFPRHLSSFNRVGKKLRLPKSYDFPGLTKAACIGLLCSHSFYLYSSCLETFLFLPPSRFSPSDSRSKRTALDNLLFRRVPSSHLLNRRR